MKSAQEFFQLLQNYSQLVGTGSTYLDIDCKGTSLSGVFQQDSPSYDLLLPTPLKVEQSGTDQYKINTAQNLQLLGNIEYANRLELQGIKLQLLLTQNNQNNQIKFQNVHFRDYQDGLYPIIECIFDQTTQNTVKSVQIQFINCTFENIKCPVFTTSVYSNVNVTFIQCRFRDINIITDNYMQIREYQYETNKKQRISVIMANQGDDNSLTNRETFIFEACDVSNIQGDFISTGFYENKIRYCRFKNVQGDVIVSPNLITSLQCQIQHNLFIDCANNNLVVNNKQLNTQFSNTSNTTIFKGFTDGFCIPLSKKFYDKFLQGDYFFNRQDSYFIMKFTGKLKKVFIKTQLQSSVEKQQIYELDVSDKFSTSQPGQQKVFVLTFGQSLQYTDNQSIIENVNFDLPYQKYKTIEVFYQLQAQQQVEKVQFVKFKYSSNSVNSQEVTVQQGTKINNLDVTYEQLFGGYELFDIPSIQPEQETSNWVFRQQQFKKLMVEHLDSKFFYHVQIDPTTFTGDEFKFFKQTTNGVAEYTSIVIPKIQIDRIKQRQIKDLVLYNNNINQKIERLDQTLLGQKYEVIDMNIQLNNDTSQNYFKFDTNQIFIIGQIRQTDSGNIIKEYYFNNQPGLARRQYCINIVNEFYSTNNVSNFVMDISMNRFIDSTYSIHLMLNKSYNPSCIVQKNVFTRSQDKQLQKFQYIQLYAKSVTADVTSEFRNCIKYNIFDSDLLSNDLSRSFAIYSTNASQQPNIIQRSVNGDYKTLLDNTSVDTNYFSLEMMTDLNNKSVCYKVLAFLFTLDSFIGEATFKLADTTQSPGIVTVKTSLSTTDWINNLQQFIVFNQGCFTVRNLLFDSQTNNTIKFKQQQNTTNGGIQNYNGYFRVQYFQRDEPQYNQYTTFDLTASNDNITAGNYVYSVAEQVKLIAFNPTSANKSIVVQQQTMKTTLQPIEYAKNIQKFNLHFINLQFKSIFGISDSNLYFQSCQTSIPVYGTKDTSTYSFGSVNSLENQQIVNTLIQLHDSKLSFTNCTFINCTIVLNSGSEVYIQNSKIQQDFNFIKNNGGVVKLYNNHFTDLFESQTLSQISLSPSDIRNNQFEQLQSNLNKQSLTQQDNSTVDKIVQHYVLTSKTTRTKDPLQDQQILLRLRKTDGQYINYKDVKKIQLRLLVQTNIVSDKSVAKPTLTNYEYQYQDVVIRLNDTDNLNTEVIKQTSNMNIIQIQKISLEFDRENTALQLNEFNEIRLYYITYNGTYDELQYMTFGLQNQQQQSSFVQLTDDLKNFYISGPSILELDVYFLVPEASTSVPLKQTPNLIFKVQRGGSTQETVYIEPIDKQLDYSRQIGSILQRRTIQYKLDQLTETKYFVDNNSIVLGQQNATKEVFNVKSSPVLINSIQLGSMLDNLIIKTIQLEVIKMRIRNGDYVYYQRNYKQQYQQNFIIDSIGQLELKFNNFWGRSVVNAQRVINSDVVKDLKLVCNNFITLRQYEVVGEMKMINTQQENVVSSMVSSNQTVVLGEINYKTFNQIPEYNRQQNNKIFNPYISKYNNLQTIYGSNSLQQDQVKYSYLTDNLDLSYEDISQNLIYYQPINQSANIYYTTGDFIQIQYGNQSGVFSLNTINMLFQQDATISGIQAGFMFRDLPETLEQGSNKDDIQFQIFDFYVKNSSNTLTTQLNIVVVSKNVSQNFNVVSQKIYTCKPNEVLQQKFNQSMTFKQNDTGRTKQEYLIKGISEIDQVVRFSQFTDGKDNQLLSPFTSKEGKKTTDVLNQYPATKVFQQQLQGTDLFTSKVKSVTYDEQLFYMMKLKVAPGQRKEIDGLFTLNKSIYVQGQELKDLLDYNVNYAKESVISNLQLTFDYTLSKASDKFIVFHNITFETLHIDLMLLQHYKVYFYRCRFMNCRLIYNKEQIESTNTSALTVPTTLGVEFNGNKSELALTPELVVDECFFFSAQPSGAKPEDQLSLISVNSKQRKSIISTYNGYTKVVNSFFHLNNSVLMSFQNWGTTQVDKQYQKIIFQKNECYQNYKQSLLFVDYTCNAQIEENVFKQQEKTLEDLGQQGTDQKTKYISSQSLGSNNTVLPVYYKPDVTEASTDKSYYSFQCFQSKPEFKFNVPTSSMFKFQNTQTNSNYIYVKIKNRISEANNILYIYMNSVSSANPLKVVSLSNTIDTVYYIVISDSINPTTNIQQSVGENIQIQNILYTNLADIESISIFISGSSYIGRTNYEIQEACFSTGDQSSINQTKVNQFLSPYGTSTVTSGQVLLKFLQPRWGYNDSAFLWQLYNYNENVNKKLVLSEKNILIHFYKFAQPQQSGMLYITTLFNNQSSITYIHEDLSKFLYNAQIGPVWLMFGDKPTEQKAIDLGFPPTQDKSLLFMQDISNTPLGTQNEIRQIYITNKSNDGVKSQDQLMLFDFALHSMSIGAGLSDKITYYYKSGEQTTQESDTIKFEEITLQQELIPIQPVIPREFVLKGNAFINIVVGIFSDIKYPQKIVQYKQWHNFFVNSLQYNMFFNKFADGQQQTNFNCSFINNCRMDKTDIENGLYKQITTDDQEGSVDYNDYKNIQQKSQFQNKIQMGNVPVQNTLYSGLDNVLQNIPTNDLSETKLKYLTYQTKEDNLDVHKCITFIQNNYDIEQGVDSSANQRTIYLFDPFRDKVIKIQIVLEGNMPDYMCILFNCNIPEKILNSKKQYIDILSFKMFRLQTIEDVELMVKMTAKIFNYIIPFNSIFTLYPVDQFIVINDQTVCTKYVKYYDQDSVKKIEDADPALRVPMDKIMQITNYQNDIIRIVKTNQDVQSNEIWAAVQNLLQKQQDKIVLPLGQSYNIEENNIKSFLLTQTENIEIEGTLDNNNEISNTFTNLILITNNNQNKFKNLKFKGTFVFRGQCDFDNCVFEDLKKPPQPKVADDSKSDIKANIIPDNQLIIPNGISNFTNCHFKNCNVVDYNLIDTGMNNTNVTFTNCTFESCSMQELIKVNRGNFIGCIFKSSTNNSIHIDGSKDHIIYEKNSLVQSLIDRCYFINSVQDNKQKITKIFYKDQDSNLTDKSKIVNDETGQQYLQPIEVQKTSQYNKHWLFNIQNKQTIELPEIVETDIQQSVNNYVWVRFKLPKTMKELFKISLVDADSKVIASQQFSNVQVNGQSYEENLLVVFGSGTQYSYHVNFNGLWRSIPNAFSNCQTVSGNDSSQVVVADKKYRISQNMLEQDPTQAGQMMKLNKMRNLVCENIENVQLLSMGYFYDTLKTEIRKREYIYGPDPTTTGQIQPDPNIIYVQKYNGVQTSQDSGLKFQSQLIHITPIVNTTQSLGFFMSVSRVPDQKFPELDLTLTISNPTSDTQNVVVKQTIVDTQVKDRTYIVFTAPTNQDQFRQLFGTNIIFINTVYNFTPKDVKLLINKQFTGNVQYQFILIDSGYVYTQNCQLYRSTFEYHYYNSGRNPLLQNTDILISDKNSHNQNINRIELKRSFFNDRFILGIEKCVEDENLLNIHDITYTNYDSSIQEQLFIATPAQMYGKLKNMVNENVQLQYQDYPKSTTDIFVVDSTAETPNSEFSDQDGNKIYLRQLQPYRDGVKYQTNLYDPIGYSTTVLNFELVNGTAQDKVYTNSFASMDSIYFLVQNVGLQKFKFKTDLLNTQTIKITDNKGVVYNLNSTTNTVELNVHNPDVASSKTLYRIQLIDIKNVPLKQGNVYEIGQQLLLINGLLQNIIYGDGAIQEEPVKKSKRSTEETVKRSKKGNLLDFDPIDQLDILLEQNQDDYEYDDEDDEDDEDDVVNYYNNDINIEYDQFGFIVPAIYKFMLGVTSVAEQKLSLYQNKELITEAMRKQQNLNNYKQKYINDFEQMKSKNINEIFQIQQQNDQITKQLQQQQQQLDQEIKNVKQQQSARLQKINEEHASRLRELDQYGQKNVQEQKQQLQLEYEHMKQQLQQSTEQQLQQIKKREHAFEKDQANKKKELEQQLKKIKQDLYEQQQQQKQELEKEKIQYQNEINELKEFSQQRQQKQKELDEINKQLQQLQQISEQEKTLLQQEKQRIEQEKQQLLDNKQQVQQQIKNIQDEKQQLEIEKQKSNKDNTKLQHEIQQRQQVVEQENKQLKNTLKELQQSIIDRQQQYDGVQKLVNTLNDERQQMLEQHQQNINLVKKEQQLSMQLYENEISQLRQTIDKQQDYKVLYEQLKILYQKQHDSQGVEILPQLDIPEIRQEVQKEQHKDIRDILDDLNNESTIVSDSLIFETQNIQQIQQRGKQIEQEKQQQIQQQLQQTVQQNKKQQQTYIKQQMVQNLNNMRLNNRR